MLLSSFCLIFDCFLSYQLHHHLQTAYYILLYCCISSAGFIQTYSKLVAENNEWIVRTMVEILLVYSFNCSLSCDMVSGALCFDVWLMFGWCLSQSATWVIIEYQINRLSTCVVFWFSWQIIVIWFNIILLISFFCLKPY